MSSSLSLVSKDEADEAHSVVPTDDAHGSEYVSDTDKRRDYISGFDGSAGTAIITHDKAYLFTDGRYFLQADKQLDSNWTLMKRGEKGASLCPTWGVRYEEIAQTSRPGKNFWQRCAAACHST